MEIAFRSIERVFAREEKLQRAGIVSFTKTAAGYSLRFHLERGNFDQVLEFLPFLQNPLFEGLGPQEGDATTESEYLEMIELALGAEGAAKLKTSTIETRVAVKGTLVSQYLEQGVHDPFVGVLRIVREKSVHFRRGRTQDRR